MKYDLREKQKGSHVARNYFLQSGLLKGLANDDTWRGHLLLESDQWCSVLVVSMERYTAGTHQQGEY